MIRKSKKNGALRQKRGDGLLMHITHPPQIPELNVKHGIQMRYVAGAAAATQNITFQNLLDTFLVATSAVSAVDLFDSVRIRAVEIWATPILGQATTVEVTFVGNAAGGDGSSKTTSDTSMSVQPAHVRATPGRMSAQALWQQSLNEVAFQISCPAGSVIDLHLSFKMRYTTGVVAQNALVGATTGQRANRGFDGLAIATTKFVPVSDNPV